NRSRMKIVPFVVDDVVGAAAYVVIKVLAEVIRAEVIDAGRVIAGAVCSPDLFDELRRRRIDARPRDDITGKPVARDHARSCIQLRGERVIDAAETSARVQ